MEEQIVFSSEIIHKQIESEIGVEKLEIGVEKLEIDVNVENGNTWSVKGNWCKDVEDLDQQVAQYCIKNEERRFEIFYYMDVEISPAKSTSVEKIRSSVKVCSSLIRININMFDYKNLMDQSERGSCTIFQHKVVLTPIYDLVTRSEPRPKRRTRADISEELETFSRDIGTLLREDTNADVTLRCGDKERKAHRNILSARSTWFNRKIQEEMNTNDMPKDQQPDVNSKQKEPLHPIIDLNDLDISIFDEFLDLIYTGIYDKTYDLQKLKYLYLAACHYGIDDLEVELPAARILELRNEMLSLDVIGFLKFALTRHINQLEYMIIKPPLEEHYRNLQSKPLDPPMEKELADFLEKESPEIFNKLEPLFKGHPHLKKRYQCLNKKIEMIIEEEKKKEEERKKKIDAILSEDQANV